nr:serine/arginine repetitive matrix protein 2-like [Ipomoea batatas]
MYRNSVRAHSRRRSAFGGKTLETRTVARTVDSSLPPINRRSTVRPTLSPSAIRRSEPPEHKRRISVVSRREVFSHPPSSYSNTSTRDYDEGDEAVSESSSPSTGGSTFNQIDEVEHVSPLAEESEGPTRPTASTEDVSSSGRGKSPRRTRALTDAAAKISSEVYDYHIFRTPESYKSANLEPPDYGREEKYESVPLAVPTTGGVLAEPSQGMSPDRTFIAPAAAPRPKTKVALGAKKVATKPAADPPVTNVPDVTPTNASSGGGKKSAKRRKSRSCFNLPPLSQLTHTTTDLFSRARALEGIREKEVVPLQKQVSAAEGRIRELEKELAATEDRAEKAERKLGEAEARADKAENAEKEAIDKMKDASSLARFICTDEAVAKEFLTAFINTEVGDKLTWVCGQWAFSSGCRAIEEQVHTALAEGLEESDLPVVMALLPDKVADPGPRPYSKPGPSE